MMHNFIRAVFVLSFFFILSAATMRAEPFGVALLRPDSLAGWDYGPRPPAGWTIPHGRLSGSRRCIPAAVGFLLQRL